LGLLARLNLTGSCESSENPGSVRKSLRVRIPERSAQTVQTTTLTTRTNQPEHTKFTDMIEHHLDIQTPDGLMTSFVAHPDGGGPRPVALFLMDAPGKREELHDMVRRLASAGYFTIVSNLYYRDVPQYNVFETGDMPRMFELMNNVSNAQAVADCRHMLTWAAQFPEHADVSRVGVTGYCMSGPFALMAAAGMPEVKAAASFHGVALAKDADDSPHRAFGTTTAELYVGAAETDSYAPPEVINAYEAAAKAAGANAVVEWYPGTQHGFVFPQRPMYDKPAAERHWSRLHDLFRRNLL
jgi:carboxymethylenebutenolidase